jgi:hypothetical protein
MLEIADAFAAPVIPYVLGVSSQPEPGTPMRGSHGPTLEAFKRFDGLG